MALIECSKNAQWTFSFTSTVGLISPLATRSQHVSMASNNGFHKCTKHYVRKKYDGRHPLYQLGQFQGYPRQCTHQGLTLDPSASRLRGSLIRSTESLSAPQLLRLYDFFSVPICFADQTRTVDAIISGLWWMPPSGVVYLDEITE